MGVISEGPLATPIISTRFYSVLMPVIFPTSQARVNEPFQGSRSAPTRKSEVHRLANAIAGVCGAFEHRGMRWSGGRGLFLVPAAPAVQWGWLNKPEVGLDLMKLTHPVPAEHCVGSENSGADLWTTFFLPKKIRIPKTASQSTGKEGGKPPKPHSSPGRREKKSSAPASESIAFAFLFLKFSRSCFKKIQTAKPPKDQAFFFPSLFFLAAKRPSLLFS